MPRRFSSYRLRGPVLLSLGLLTVGVSSLYSSEEPPANDSAPPAQKAKETRQEEEGTATEKAPWATEPAAFKVTPTETPREIPQSIPPEVLRQRPTELPPEALRTRPTEPPDPSTLPDEEEIQRQLELLDQFLSLPTDQLARIRRMVEQLERMTPEERHQLRTRLAEFRRLQPVLKRELTANIETVPPADRELLRQRWLQMSAEARKEESERIASMQENERKSYYRDLITDLRKAKETASNPDD